MSDRTFPVGPFFWSPPVTAEVAEYIDYAALIDVMRFEHRDVDLDHDGLVIEAWMWADHERRLAHWYETGMYEHARFG